MLNRNQTAPEKTIEVVAALRDLKAGEVLRADALEKRVIPFSARPADAVAWADFSLAVGQMVNRPVRRATANPFPG